MRLPNSIPVILSFALLTGLVSGCNTAGVPGSTAGDREVASLRQSPGKAAQQQLGEGCHSSDDPNRLCLALKVVSYQVRGKTVTPQALAVSNIAAINKLWAQCGIAFEIDKYEAVTPGDYGLPTGGASQNITNQIRQTFEENNTLLLVSTDPWPGTVKNAWTNMPGDSPYGVVYEGSVANFPNIIGHELGHYLGLTHAADAPNSDPDNLMNWLIYPQSALLSPAQCQTAQQNARGAWASMLR